ncbi:MAG: hypothetical protein M3Q86_08545 [Verrucomicrobiota bacterium]|nr:hypothetical protein [Verrucomicrobiota bacterium]
MKKLILSLALLALVPASAQRSPDPMLNLSVGVKTGDQVQPQVRPTPGGGC